MRSKRKRKINWSKYIAEKKKYFREKRKYILLGFALLVVVAAASLAFFIWKHGKEKKTQQQPLQLVDRYREQLEQLKDKAKSGNAQDLQSYAIALYATGDLAKAEEIYRKQLGVSGQDATTHNNLANTLRDEKKFEEAAGEYQKAIDLAPKSNNSYVNLASLYQYSLGDIDKAIEVYKEGVKANPESVDFLNLIAMAYEQKSDYLSAQKYFEDALVLKADNAVAKQGLERVKNNL